MTQRQCGAGGQAQEQSDAADAPTKGQDIDSGQEIADQLGITIHTVKTQKNRSFKFLREKLKDSVFFILLTYYV